MRRLALFCMTVCFSLFFLASPVSAKSGVPKGKPGHSAKHGSQRATAKKILRKGGSRKKSKRYYKKMRRALGG